jgi:hypothetical protein
MVETMLKAARIAKPGFEWFIGSMDKVYAYHPDGGALIFDLFSSNEILNDSNTLALQIALEKAGWEFWYGPCATENMEMSFLAVNSDSVSCHAPTKPELLLKCVEVMP